MAGKKYYVVWKGTSTGIFDNWKACEALIRGVEGAVYKSFPDLEEARRAYAGNWKDYMKKKGTGAGIAKPGAGNPIPESICVDAACSGNPGIMEYRGVDTRTGRQLFHKGPFPLGTNNIGEFLGIVHALALLEKTRSTLPVYSDSRTAIKWVKDRAIKTKLPRNEKTGTLFELLDRAILWLNTHDYPNRVLKWETESWGEIPADFGRK
ncbi:MAG: viroplasmin family protein [Bacteroidales bacterium]|jgi:ribonuclease HI|nr:viroplasmin family protein [Bacteroidales bacterium]